MRKLVILVGVPGSGKSTLQAFLARTGFATADKAHAHSLRKWIASEKIGLPIPPLRVIDKILSHYYAAMAVTNVERIEASYPDALRLFGQRLASGLLNGHISPQLYTELNYFVYDTLSRLVLSGRYPDCYKVVVQDEGWLNLALVGLNWGDEGDWMKWLRELIGVMPAPSAVIWLSRAAAVSSERQAERGRFATVFKNCPTALEKAEIVEERIRVALPILDKLGIDIQVLDSMRSQRSIQLAAAAFMARHR